MLKDHLFIIFSLCLLLVLPRAAWPADRNHDKGDGTIVVSGIGYPPIKAVNPVQARLTARRAAIADAYRNALAAAGGAGDNEKTFYRGLAGFVKGLTVENEEFLPDGGIRIRARVSLKNVGVSMKRYREGAGEKGRGASTVPLDEWYKLIERSVQFE